VATYSGIQEIPLVAGHPALDLVNTVEPRLPASVPGEPHLDHLATPSDLLVWVVRAGLLDEAEAITEAAAWKIEPGLADRCLAEVVAAREALYAVLSSRLEEGPGGGEEAQAQLALIMANWAAAAARTQLRPGPGGPREFEMVVGIEPGLVTVDRIAVATVELLTTSIPGRLRACPLEEGGCGWLFLDRSRAHTRRWCVMADCGTKAKSRRLNDRRRAARARR
jgi:predicted RNA-binding Zn ribbon-like protein